MTKKCPQNNNSSKPAHPQDTTRPKEKSDRPAEPAQGAPPLKIDHPSNTTAANKDGGDKAPWWEKAAVLIGIGLLIANWFQGYQTEKATSIASDTLILDERPWVGPMGDGHVSIEIAKGSPIKFHIDVENFGKTPALDERGIAHLTTRPIKTRMTDFGNCSDTEQKDASAPVTLMPTAIAQYNFTTDAPSSAGIKVILTEADIDLINSEQVQLFMYGCLWYRDTFNNPHKTQWCLQYNPPTGEGGHATNFSACLTHNHAS